MVPVKQYISSLSPKEVMVINTHFHWDHVWGNCAFKDKKIIAHEGCRELLNRYWDNQIEQSGKYVMGNAEKVLPNILFKEKISFADDGIEIFYSPGHTLDSISIFDHHEKILYVGDNIEKPIVYVENADINIYIKTLKNYLKYLPERILASHTLEISKTDLFDTIDYLEALTKGKFMVFEEPYVMKIHEENFELIHGKS